MRRLNNGRRVARKTGLPTCASNTRALLEYFQNFDTTLTDYAHETSFYNNRLQNMHSCRNASVKSKFFGGQFPTPLILSGHTVLSLPRLPLQMLFVSPSKGLVIDRKTGSGSPNVLRTRIFSGIRRFSWKKFLNLVNLLRYSNWRLGGGSAPWLVLEDDLVTRKFRLFFYLPSSRTSLNLSSKYHIFLDTNVCLVETIKRIHRPNDFVNSSCWLGLETSSILYLLHIV